MVRALVLGVVLGALLPTRAAALGPAGPAAAPAAPWAEPVDGLRVYFGDLHAHTSYSDGEGTPKDAYGYARLVGGLDFLGLSDHAYMLNPRADHVADLWAQATAATIPGRFVALAGAEWTQSSEGHINVFIEASHAGKVAFPDRVSIPAYPVLYRWLEGHPEAFAQFNHPGFDIQQNWDAFRHDVGADPSITLLEVGNGPFDRNLRYEASYQMALDRGWHVGAAANSDVHRAQWGTATGSRTAVWAAALTPEALVAAVRARRTYATEDPDARLVFRAGEAWMGARLAAPATVRLQVALWDPDPQDRFAAVELVGPGGTAVRRVDLGGVARASAEWEIPVPWGRAYLYVRARQADGDRLISSPIWLEHPSGVWVVDLALGARPVVAGRPVPVTGTLINGTGEPVRLRVTWRSPGAEGGPVDVTVAARSTAPLEFTWTPAEAGPQRVVLDLQREGAPADPPNRYGLEVAVRERARGRVGVDEAHNNRYSGLASALLDRLAGLGFDTAVVGEPFTPERLAEVDLLMLAAPQGGFALTATELDGREREALAEFVRRGGRLVLLGSSAPEDAGHGVAQLNRILEALGASLRFGGPLAPGAVEVALAGGALVEGAAAGSGRRLYLRDAAAIEVPGPPAGGRDGDGSAIEVLAWGRLPDGRRTLLLAAQRLGRGTVVVGAAPTYSPYEYRRRGEDHAWFEDRLVAHLLDSR